MAPDQPCQNEVHCVGCGCNYYFRLTTVPNVGYFPTQPPMVFMFNWPPLDVIGTYAPPLGLPLDIEPEPARAKDACHSCGEDAHKKGACPKLRRQWAKGHGRN